MFICIKIDLALNILQRLICHKIQLTTNQPTNLNMSTILCREKKHFKKDFSAM